jgi:hypothetical protein
MAIGIGIPATVAWFVIIMFPWIPLIRGDDPWNLRPLFFFVIIPTFICGTAESVLGEARYPQGILFFASWMLAERYRLKVAAEAKSRQPVVRQSAFVAALSGPAPGGS